MNDHSRWPANFDVVAIFCVAVLPDMVRSYFSLTETAQSSTYSFAYLHCAWIVRALQVSLPILLIMHLKNVNWREHGFTRVRPFRDLAVATGLIGFSYAAWFIAYMMLARLGPNFQVMSEAGQAMIRDMSPPSTIALPVIVASGLANGFAEELAMRAYFIPRLVQLSGSRTVAVLLTSVVFALYHLYQGPVGAVHAFSIGLVFGIYFVTARRFWPVALAHAAMDVLPQLMRG